METYKIRTKIKEEHKLTIENLPFKKRRRSRGDDYTKIRFFHRRHNEACRK